MIDKIDLENRFTFHPVRDKVQEGTYEHIRGAAKWFASLVNMLCPDSREKSLAVTHIEEVVFWANAAVARNEIDGQDQTARVP